MCKMKKKGAFFSVMFFTVLLLVKCHQGRETGLIGVICCLEVRITELLRVAEVSGRIPSPTSHVCFVQFAFTSPKIASFNVSSCVH